ncbi:MAG: hypothetical protein MK076_03900 [Flavobacteriales bacterium]|nr:hypothetical protein [Flavobacteriales bacterium]NQY00532.1 hypothetical protein [Flavobacteriaceae bacterium]
MELAKIEKLVVKYENAETTLEEEAILSAYFLSGNVATHLEEYQRMFQYFQESKDETYGKSMVFKTQKRKKYGWLSMVASIVLLFGVYIGFSKQDPIISTSEMGVVEKFQFEQTKEALILLSRYLNKGNQAFDQLYAYETLLVGLVK